MNFFQRLFTKTDPTLEQQRDSGSQATQLWENKAFAKAILNVRMGIHESWAGSPVDDLEGQQKLRLLLKLLDDIEGNIRKEMNDGVMASAVIKEREEKDKRAKNISLFRR